MLENAKSNYFSIAQSTSSKPVALVVGLCSHGLAMARALASCDVEVHAFEANKALPGTSTKTAKVHFVENINRVSLIADLLKFREAVPVHRKIILLLTNDNNVRVVGEHMETLADHYLISWRSCAATILSLLKKSNIEARCQETGLLYPKSYVIHSIDQIDDAAEHVSFTAIVKPVNPQSSFKALKCENKEELKHILSRYESDLPILMQTWIEGGDKDLYFGALYLQKGEPVAKFVGNKIESFPPAMGQTTVAVSAEDERVTELTEIFFKDLGVCGPVSLELKKDDQGNYWVIEPTIGRTDFWFGLCAASGCNLIQMEVEDNIGQLRKPPTKLDSAIWFDSERDITAPLRLSGYFWPRSKRYKATFSYFDTADTKPYLQGIKKTLTRLMVTQARRVFSLALSREQTKTVKVFNAIDQIPAQYLALIKASAKDCVFIGNEWYVNFCEKVADLNGQIRFYCLQDRKGEPLAILPMWYQSKKSFGYSLRTLSSLTNYYSPIFDVSFNSEKIDKTQTLTELFQAIKTMPRDWDLIDLFPLYPETLQATQKASKANNLASFSYFHTKNFFLPVNFTFDEYIASRPGRLRNTLKRKKRKLNACEDWQLLVYKDFEGLDKALEEYHFIYQHSWKESEPFPDFINGLAHMAAAKGWLRLGLLRIKERPIAAQIWLIANQTAYIYKLAYDNEFRHYSPGSILTEHLFKQAITEDKVKLIDFLTGTDSFKKDWMEQSRNLVGVQIVNRRSVGGLFHFARNYLAQFRKSFSIFH